MGNGHEGDSMDTVESADGTTIAVETTGSGPALVVAVGAFCDRTTTRPLAELLADRFTVHAYDRRGRGDSPEVAPYSVARELEDLAAVVRAAGDAPALYGHSSGAIIALRAVAAGLPVSRLVAFEPPWLADADDATAGRSEELGHRLDALAARGQAEELVEAFVGTAFDMPPEAVAGLKRSPGWAWMVSFAASVRNDAAVAGDQRIPSDALAAITVPTLVLAGGASAAWARDTASAVADTVPGARLDVVAGQDHRVDHAVLAPLLASYLTGSASHPRA